MTATRAQITRCTHVRERILVLLGARLGGHTRLQAESILEYGRREVAYALRTLIAAGKVDRHGTGVHCTYQYTLAGDPLIRQPTTCRAASGRMAQHEARKQAILALLARGPLLRSVMARRLGVKGKDAIAHDLRRMREAGLIEAVGENRVARYRLATTVRVKLSPPCVGATY